MTKPIKFEYHKFGTINKTMFQEEKLMLASVERALSSTNNSAILGQNGELPLKNFLNSYLPNCFSVETGQFIDSKGNISPQIDIMVLDSRFPVLARNSDNSVLAIAESVIFCISVKLRVIKRDIEEMTRWANKILLFSRKIFGKDKNSWKQICLEGITYFAGNSMSTLEKNFFELSKANSRELGLTILRIKEKAQDSSPEGTKLWWESLKLEMRLATHSPLSDFLYALLQNSYYTLATRNLNYQKIGAILMNYFHWGTKRE